MFHYRSLFQLTATFRPPDGRLIKIRGMADPCDFVCTIPNLRPIFKHQRNLSKWYFSGETVLRSSDCVKKRKKEIIPVHHLNFRIFFFFRSYLKSHSLWIAQFRTVQKSNHNFVYTCANLLKFSQFLPKYIIPANFVLIGTFFCKTVEIFLDVRL